MIRLRLVTKALRRNIASLIMVAADVTPANLLDPLRNQAALNGVPVVTLATKAMLGALVGLSSTSALSLNRGQDYALVVVNQLEAAAAEAAAAMTKALRRNNASLILVAANVTPANLLDPLRNQAALKGVPVVTLDTKAMLGALVGLPSATAISLNRGQDYALLVVNQLEAAAAAASERRS
ncbi:hypothetical protein AALP_AA4G142400 [Arabis alpina]|uniref:Ribosomal protein eL8/eL30/eS12/Gadd45 domain-containing protein n=1 Tax=Arabis alpina TaxID=50452 RepID=A0A087H380_ARAAL|nr:hypothetical protein AALP_AA4G142400 [Arabis alpina]